MSGAVEFGVDRATVTQLAGHLLRCDASFVPPLSSRVDVAGYAGKIAAHATRFEAWADGALVGLVAAYGSDRAGGVAFVTNVSVVPEWQRRGIASSLLAHCIGHARSQGLGRLDLEVDAGNAGAIDFYAGAGFTAGAQTGGVRTLHLAIERTPP